MRAIAALPPEGGDSLPLVELEGARPTPGDHDLLVRVEAVAVNPVDAKVHAALPAGSAPRVLGWDAAGLVEEVGAAVRRFRPGDAVFFAGDVTRAGCRARYVAVDGRICGRKPANLTFAEAAALPLTGLTAWEALFDRLGLDPEGADAGRSLLILGGAGGVGSMAIQLARRAGLVVLATASRPASRQWVRELGAERVVDHTRPLAEQLRGMGIEAVDRIANFHDTDAYWPAMVELIRPQGAIVAIVGNRTPLDLNLLKEKSVRFCWEYMFTRSRFTTPDMGEQGRILDRLAGLVEAGELRSTLRRQLGPIGVDSLAEAQALLAEGHAVGKIVVAGWD